MSTAARTETLTLAAAMDVLAREIESGDGVANAAIAEAAQRLRDLKRENAQLKQANSEAMHALDDLASMRKECARLQMELDASCNAEELRQVRAENASLRRIAALDALTEESQRLGLYEPNAKDVPTPTAPVRNP